jgi:hypothetical protein
MDKVIYISGKIGNLPHEVYEKHFFEAESLLTADGWVVVNPVKIDHSGHNKTWAAYMIRDLEALIPCDAVYMLSNWTDSRGAKIEHEFAVGMGKQILYQQSEVKRG